MRPDYASGVPASAILNASGLVMDYGAANVRAAADHGTAGTGPAPVHTLALNHVDFTLCGQFPFQLQRRTLMHHISLPPR